MTYEVETYEEGGAKCVRLISYDDGALHQMTLDLVHESGIINGTGTLYVVCRQAILDGDGTPDAVRRIWRDATDEAETA